MARRRRVTPPSPPAAPVRTCHARNCNCERFVPRTPIAGWPSCECTHTEHVHREQAQR